MVNCGAGSGLIVPGVKVGGAGGSAGTLKSKALPSMVGRGGRWNWPICPVKSKFAVNWTGSMVISVSCWAYALAS